MSENVFPFLINVFRCLTKMYSHINASTVFRVIRFTLIPGDFGFHPVVCSGAGRNLRVGDPILPTTSHPIPISFRLSDTHFRSRLCAARLGRCPNVSAAAAVLASKLLLLVIGAASVRDGNTLAGVFRMPTSVFKKLVFPTCSMIFAEYTRGCIQNAHQCIQKSLFPNVFNHLR